jgi:hypothetical protein
MAAPALADLLPDFAPRTSAPVLAAHREPAGEPAFVAVRPAAPVDMAALLAKEYARAEEEVAARLLGERDAMLAAERERHAAELADAERRYGEAAGARLARGLAELEQRLAATLTGAAARILGMVASEEVARRGVEALALALAEALEDADAAAIRVSGPMSLFAALAERMGERASHLRHIETDTLDLTVEVDGSLLETRLSEWQAMLHEALS